MRTWKENRFISQTRFKSDNSLRRTKKKHNVVGPSLIGAVGAAAINKTPNEDHWDGQTKFGFSSTPNE